MSVRWNAANCAAHTEAMGHDEVSTEWKEYALMRNSMIMALLVTGFPAKSDWAITEGNWRQVFIRLSQLESAGGAYRHYMDGRKVKFSPAEVHSMISLEVNAGNKSEAEWRKDIESISRREAESALRNHDRTVKEAA